MLKLDNNDLNLEDILGDEHVYTSLSTPLRKDAFDMSDEQKMAHIAYHFEQIMHTMGLDLTDDSLSGTPKRVAKMYIKEVFSGLNPANKPKIALFDNKYRYNEMLVEKNITVKSFCEHHFVPITGVAHVAYISSGKVIGLSKINRIVEYFAKRPQVQERLTVQIAEELRIMLETDDVAVVLDARHMCVSMRGVEDDNSSTVTSSYHGKFKEISVKNEFFKYLG
jgi:GTP cyclohydrolase I